MAVARSSGRGLRVKKKEQVEQQAVVCRPATDSDRNGEGVEPCANSR